MSTLDAAKASPALVLFRRDLRLGDNPALHAACARAERVLPIYIWDTDADGAWPPGAASRWWLHHSLVALDTSLREVGARLLVCRGDTLEVLRQMIRCTGADSVHWNRCYEAARITCDRRVKEALHEDGVAAYSHKASVLAEPWQLATGDGKPYRVYSPFGRRFAQDIAIDAPLPPPAIVDLPEVARRTLPVECGIDALALLPRIRWDNGLQSLWQPGENGAHERLEAFFESAAASYHRGREFPGEDGTSRLSPHLHFGDISPRQCWARSRRAIAEDGRSERGVAHFRRELVWREFAHHLIYHYPDTATQPLNPRFSNFPWRRPDEYAADLAAFQRGVTGFPIIDAGMRQLWNCGWMHNRVRMIVGSFLTKNLRIPWQEGAAWFWDTLVDADLASNTLGWQWAAGSGADAAPYFRIFNPLLQAQKFDADGDYVRRWVPELAALPPKALHAPWLSTPEILADAGIRLGAHYPEPMVDLQASRERALAAYEQVKG